MKNKDRIRKRKSYERFKLILEAISLNVSVDEKMKYIYLQMNDMYAFGSRKNADFALESLKLLLNDNKR